MGISSYLLRILTAKFISKKHVITVIITQSCSINGLTLAPIVVEINLSSSDVLGVSLTEPFFRGVLYLLLLSLFGIDDLLELK